MLKIYNKVLSDMLIDLLSHKVSVEFVNKFTIKTIDTIKVGGYFLYDPLELKCATKRSDKKWISLLMHEYCHFRQYIEKSELFWIVKLLSFITI